MLYCSIGKSAEDTLLGLPEVGHAPHLDWQFKRLLTMGGSMNVLAPIETGMKVWAPFLLAHDMHKPVA